MLKKIQQDFSYYSHEFKDNYRKGVHRLRTILASRAQAQAFVSNAGGVAVVLGYEPDKPDKNAQELYALLMASPYIDDAVQTFLGSIYEGAESQDAMYSDSARCLEILHDPVMSRAAGAGTVSAGKWIATLAGQSCAAYTGIAAVAASETAMTAVAASETAMAAVVSNVTALNAVVTSRVALNAVAASETAMAAIIGNATALNVVATSQAAMNAVAASETAMTAVIANTAAFNTVVTSHVAMNAVASSYVAVAAVYESAVAVEAVKANETAWATLTGASSAVMGKAAAKLAGLNPADYADMTAVASSSTAMAAIIGNSTALNAVVSSSTAMAAVASSKTAATAIEASSTAVSALISSPLKVTDSGGYGHTNNKRNVRSGRAFIISVKFGTSSNTSYYGNISTFLLGSSSYRATCNASARAINRFATSIVCYGEYTGSLNDNVNYSQVVYIPC